MAKPPAARTALAVLTGVNLLNYVDRYIPAGALPLIMATFAVTDTKGGMLQSLFMFPYAIVSPLAGTLGDRRRRFGVAGVGVLIWSLATLASGLAPTFGMLLVARVIIGIGEASYSVVTPPLLADYYPPARRTSVLTTFYAALPMGSALGFMVGGIVGTHLGWRAAFLLAGIPGLALALALLAFKDPPRAGSTPGGADRSAPAAGAALGWGQLLRYPSYVLNVAAQSIYTFAIGGLAAWMPTYFYRERGLSLSKATLIFGGIVCVAGFVGTIAGGKVCNAVARRSRVATFTVPGISLILAAPFTWLAILSPTPIVYWPAMFLTLMLLFVNTGPLNAAITNVLPGSVQARGFGACTMSIHMLGDAFSPMLIGFVSTRLGGLRLPVVATGLLPVAAGLVLLAGRSAFARDLQRAELLSAGAGGDAA